MVVLRPSGSNEFIKIALEIHGSTRNRIDGCEQFLFDQVVKAGPTDLQVLMCFFCCEKRAFYVALRG